MIELLSLGLSLWIGFLLVTIFDPLANLHPRWAGLLFRISLGTCVGIGCSASAYFALVIVGVAQPWAILAIEVPCAGFLTALWLRRVGPASARSNEESSPARWIVAGIFLVALLTVLGRLTQVSIANPSGEWDATAIWNLRAKFLTDQQNWRWVASQQLATRPEYPLLLSSFIARGWKLSGDFRALVPLSLGLTFFATLIGLTVSSLVLIRGTIAGLLGGLILLSTSPLLFWAPAQYADIPLACFFLATLALLFIDARNEERSSFALIWAGVCAGLAGGMKNEGGVFAVIVTIAFLAQRPPLRRAKLFLAALIAASLPAIYQKVALPTPTWIGQAQTGAGVLARIQDPSRYSVIGKALIDRLTGLGSLPGHPLILLAFLALLASPTRDRRDRSAVWISSIAVTGMFLSYLAIYLITPLDLPWQLWTSFERVLLQVWPSFVLLFCRLLPGDAGFDWTRRA